MIYDAFMYGGEADILECRLMELENVPLKHIVVEAKVTHQDNPKPLFFEEQKERFAPWADRIIYVVADSLPSRAEDADPWARELAQRTYIVNGLKDAESTDVLLHSDVDEIPNPLVVRNLKPRGIVAFEMRGHFFAVDWLYPPGWRGTVACTVGSAPDMRAMRNLRNVAKGIPNAGWHLSWLGGSEATWNKLHAYCHPEIEGRVAAGLTDGHFYRDGIHVDGVKMLPVDVDKTWPRWVYERKCPANWFRPRDVP